MTATAKTIICKSCAKTIAAVSSSGLSPVASETEPQSCGTCHQFRPLYDAMQAADKAYASFAKKPDNYRPKQAALVNVRQTHMRLDNFLIGVEGAAEDPAATASNPHARSEDHKMVVEGKSHGTKRSRSYSSIGEDYSSAPLPSVCGIDSLPERKRIKFSDSVEFRKEYRPSEHFSRNGEAYQRGRYAPPEGGEHLDTSGSSKTAFKFTGMKKVGKKWVDVLKEDDDNEREDDKKELKNKDTANPDVKSTDTSSTVEDNATRSETTPITHRLVRRSSRTPQSIPTHTTITAKPGRRQAKSANMQTPNANTFSATQPSGTGKAITTDDAGTRTHTTESSVEDEGEDTRSPSGQMGGNPTTRTIVSLCSVPYQDMTGGQITGHAHPDTSTASGTAEEHTLQSQSTADNYDRQFIQDKHNGSSETNFARPGEQRRADCEAIEQFGIADGPLATPKRADIPDGAEVDPPNEIKSLGASLNDNADVTSDNKSGFQVFQIQRGGEGEVTTSWNGNFQAEVEAQKRDALSTPAPLSHAPPHQVPGVLATDQLSNCSSHATHAQR